MELMELLQLLGILFAVIFVIVLILSNHLLSRILSMVFCGSSIYVAHTNMGALESILWNCIWLTILGWLLYVGLGVLGHATGWIIIDDMCNAFPEIVHGPVFHIVTSLLVFGLAYHYIAMENTIWFYIIPGGIIILDVISLIKGE